MSCINLSLEPLPCSDQSFICATAKPNETDLVSFSSSQNCAAGVFGQRLKERLQDTVWDPVIQNTWNHLLLYNVIKEFCSSHLTGNFHLRNNSLYKSETICREGYEWPGDHGTCSSADHSPSPVFYSCLLFRCFQVQRKQLSVRLGFISVSLEMSQRVRGGQLFMGQGCRSCHLLHNNSYIETFLFVTRRRIDMIHWLYCQWLLHVCKVQILLVWEKERYCIHRACMSLRFYNES